MDKEAQVTEQPCPESMFVKVNGLKGGIESISLILRIAKKLASKPLKLQLENTGKLEWNIDYADGNL